MLTDPQCYGCNQTIPVLDDAFCGDLTPCLTPCEINVLAQLNVSGRACRILIPLSPSFAHQSS